MLPSQYDTLTRVSLSFVFLLAAAQVLFFWNVLQTLRGKAGVATFDERGIPMPATSSKDWSVHAAEAALVLVALLLAFAFAVGGYLVGREHAKGGGTATTTGDDHERQRAPSRATAKAGAAAVRERRLRRLPHACGRRVDRERRPLARRRRSRPRRSSSSA